MQIWFAEIILWKWFRLLSPSCSFSTADNIKYAFLLKIESCNIVKQISQDDLGQCTFIHFLLIVGQKFGCSQAVFSPADIVCRKSWTELWEDIHVGCRWHDCGNYLTSSNCLLYLCMSARSQKKKKNGQYSPKWTRPKNQ